MDNATPNTPFDYNAELAQSIANIAPLVSSQHGAQFTPQKSGLSFVDNSPQQSSSGGALSKFGHFLGGLFSETGHMAVGAGKWLEKQTVEMAEAPFKFGASLAHQIQDNMLLDQNMKQIQQQSAVTDRLNDEYKAGRITAEQYKQALQDNFNTLQDLARRAQIYGQMGKEDFSTSVKSGVETVSDIVTVLTGGLGKSADVALTSDGLVPVLGVTDYLKSSAADVYLNHVEPVINKFASDSKLFSNLSTAAQHALQTATAEVVSSETAMGASQVARATIVNIALKYPIYFDYLSNTGEKLYNELDQKKYGDAVRTLAFNSALALSGGPIGWAMKHGGQAFRYVSARTFVQTPFLDSLSRMVGDKDPQGFFNAVAKLSPEARGEAAKGLSAVEATNIAAVGGHDATAAALRVVRGMRSQYEALDWAQLTHEQALKDMVNFAKNQRIADEWGKKLGRNLTVGRFDVRDKTQIAKQLADAPLDTRLSTWEQMKLENPDKPWANNANFDRQIRGLIEKHPDGEDLGTAIQNIKAATAIEGVPKTILSQMAKDGYVVIQPSKLDAPFVEGSGKITSSFAHETNDIFLKAVKPLPVLSTLGQTLTRLGLSPNASTQTVYEMFSVTLADNIKNTSAIFKDMAGESTSQQADMLIKKLSSYAHDENRKGLFSKTPIMDLRQMTNKDIQTALGVPRATAREVQDAITQAYIQVPLAVRGLGDKAVDLLYKAPGVGSFARRFFRVQGAARFSWNPFFQYLRVAPKTEILTSAEGGGYINAIFQGHIREIKDIRQGLRDIGAFEEKAGFSLSTEAVGAEGTSATRNLNHKLLPIQERSIAGLIAAQADRVGMDWHSYVHNFPQNVRDTVQSIAQYDRSANFINSPLARTLNIAFFPFRFDAKVAGIFAKSLARQNPLMQVAVINGLYRAHNWLNSPEGQVWYSQNATAIGVFNYITPTATFAEVFSALTPGHDHSLGNFGELGGLPFGWIPQLLDSEGITHFNQPYVTAQGVEIPDYIPATTRGQAAIAIQDFVTSIFSYPGATAGLPSKSKITRTIGEGLTGANTSDFNKVLRPLSNDQQDFINNVASKSKTSTSSSPQPLRGTVTVPQGSSPLQTPPQRSTGSKTRKKKESEFTPALLPGQTELGQL